MRRLLAICVIAATVPATAQLPPGQPFLPKPPADPPGTIVIRPKVPANPPTIVPPGASAKVVVNRSVDPDRPGLIVFKPSGAATIAAPSGPDVTMLPPPRSNDIPHISIIRPKSTDPDPIPPAPGTGAKPSDQPPLPQPVPKPEEPKEKDPSVLYEAWEGIFCRGYKVGHFHIVVREMRMNDQKVLYAVKTMKLQVARFGQPAEITAEESSIEKPTGEVLVTKLVQAIGNGQQLVVTGRVTDKGMEVSVEGNVKDSKLVKWPDGVIGVAREARIHQEKKPKPGDKFDFLAYVGMFGAVVKYNVTAKPLEEVTLPSAAKPRKLLPVVAEMDLGNGTPSPLGPTTTFIDPDTFEVVKTEADMPTLGGRIVSYRTTREAALKAPGKRLDLFDTQSIKLNRNMSDIYGKAGAVYKVTLGGDLPLDRVFPTDDRQQVKNIDAKARTLELHVTAVRQPVRPDQPAVRPGKEFLADCFFIDWDNEPTKKHAAAAVAGMPRDASDWRKAQAVEKYVSQNMKAAEFSQAMATCSNVAKSLSGDCTEFSVLAAGMCRALGIPSRTAIGVVAYHDRRANQSVLAWHMWFEVWADGRWLALDATRGEGSVGPGHIKIIETSWHEEKSFAPLLPVVAVLGTQPKVEVLKVTDR